MICQVGQLVEGGRGGRTLLVPARLVDRVVLHPNTEQMLGATHDDHWVRHLPLFLHFHCLRNYGTAFASRSYCLRSHGAAFALRSHCLRGQDTVLRHPACSKINNNVSGIIIDTILYFCGRRKSPLYFCICLKRVPSTREKVHSRICRAMWSVEILI